MGYFVYMFGPWRTSLRRAVALLATVVVASAGLLVVSAAPAAADPSANAWKQLRICESSDNYTINTGNGYYGAYQFDLGTWRSVGGTGYPHEATPAEQDYRALRLYRMRGWQPWTCAVMAGLSEDSDARSKIIPPEPASFDVPYVFAGGSLTPPAWPGVQLNEGEVSTDLKTWQMQAAALGYPVIATGFFGPKTREVVLDIQRRAGLAVVGFIGPKTWDAAWTLAVDAAGAGTDADAVFKRQTRADCQVGAAAAPDWPGETYRFGQTTLPLQCFQWQLASRGAGLQGTAYFGEVTLGYVQRLQRANGLDAVDDRGRAVVDRATWVAAWEGAF